MKFIRSAFHNDYLQLTRWELVKLFFGITLKNGAAVVSIYKNNNTSTTP
jgi:hypothetical protein